MARQPRPAGRARRAKRTPAIAFDAITLEGGLIAPAMLSQIARIEADEQTAADYGVARGLILRDEIARAYRIAQAHYADLTAHPEPSLAATQRFTEALLRDVLEFRDLVPVGRHDRDGDIYPVTFEGLGGRVPVVVVPPADGIDRVSASLTAAGRRGSAASVVQDWLNAEDAALWGLACCGTRLRLLRDNPSLTRPAYIEADLDAIFTNEGRVDFAVLWLLLHATRFGKPTDAVTDCTLERWRLAGLKEGEVARDRLRDGVEEALLALGTGFLSHPANGELRKFVGSGVIPAQAYFEQCLHLVYRLIFLFVAEDRDLLHPPQTAALKRQRYAQGYSLGSLRQASIRRSAYDAHADRWEALQVVFRGLGDGEEELGLPALSGLFEPGRMDDLESCALANRDLMRAIHRLAWLRGQDGTLPVNWRDMQTEELGSVYESLLELAPRISPNGRELLFAEGAETKGNARKTTGSYYTPDSLVQALLDTVADPVMDRVVSSSQDPTRALLSLRIIDPACGSGHFLLAAARRLATRVARVRNGGVASADQYREAMRDVVRRCVHGVDRNPMAIDLAKVALWIESIEPGKPLGFLDANLVCGDALLGTFAFGEKLDSLLDSGVPDEAYKPMTGDDKAVCRQYYLINRDERVGQGRLDIFDDKAWKLQNSYIEKLVETFREMPEDTPRERRARQELWQQAMSDPGLLAKRQAADIYVAAYLLGKDSQAIAHDERLIPTTADIAAVLRQVSIKPEIEASGSLACATARVLHWGLTFADAFAAGGFDIVVGNPPWDVIQLGEEEYFAQRKPEIALLAGSKRKKAIQDLKLHHPEIFATYERDKRAFEAANEFARSSGRFPLTARGKVNSYALFSELFAKLISSRGRAGIVVPTGIATDATTSLFFADLVANKRLIRLADFENRMKLFAAPDARMKFCLLTIGEGVESATFSFFSTATSQMNEPERNFILSADDILQINPNTKTVPVFRAREDARLTKYIYSRSRVLIEEANKATGNPWRVTFRQGLYNMTSDSALFKDASQLIDLGLIQEGTDWISDPDAAASGSDITEPVRYIPLYEAKMINFYDHRAGGYAQRGDERGYRVLPETSADEHADPNFELTPFYWVDKSDVEERLASLHWPHAWYIGFKDLTSATNERTFIPAIVPRVGVGNNLPLMFPGVTDVRKIACLLANMSSLIFDFVVRQKAGGLHMNFFYVKQFPVLPPDHYGPESLNYIIPRVLELVYTSHSMAPFARDLGYSGPPFTWDEQRRALLRAELDAWYAHAYGLTFDDLRYVLDPTDAKGPEYPSESFRGLKANELRELDEYRTSRLVTAAYRNIAAAIGARVAAE
ncbi:hypothetical protein GOFOIKOB_3998 [Methylobacterium tardum]|nr:hypothetical protein GOFOIKOB_3998 [Methylobacterium tardum]